MTGMKELLNFVLALHPSRKSLQQSVPRVELRRLSLKTINKYTGIHNVFDYDKSMSSCKSPPRKELFVSIESDFHPEFTKEDGKLPDSPSESGDSSDSSSIKEGDFSEQRNEGEDELQTADLDIASSSSTDELPNLNDPSWGKEIKRKQVKRQKKRKKNITLKTDTKLMKFARRAFQSQAVRYKSTKEFMKNTKTSKEVQNAEIKSTFPDSQPPHHVQSKVGDHRLSNTESQSVSNKSAPTISTAATMQIKEKTGSIDSAREWPAKSLAELMSLKLKESMARYVSQEKKSSVPEDATNLVVKPSNTIDKVQLVEQQSNQDEELDNSCDSNDSGCTVLFDHNEISEIYPMEFAHAALSSCDDTNVETSAYESSNNKKRKESPLNEESVETNKKLRQEARQEIISEVDETQQPMVMIPISISSPVSFSSTAAISPSPSRLTSPVLHVQTPLKTHRNSVGSSNVPSQANDAAQLVNEGNFDTDVQEKEANELPCKISSVRSVAFGKSYVDMVDTHKKVSHPSQSPQTEYVVIDISASQENGNTLKENVPAMTPDPATDNKMFITASNITSLSSNANPVSTKETNRQEESTNTIKEAVTGSNNKEIESHQKKTSSTSDSKEAVVGSKDKAFKFLKQLSVRFHELTTKRVECEKKIKQVKEEYNKKLEVLEEEKKNFDIDISRMIVAMSECKELAEEPDKEQEPAATNTSDSAAVMETGPELTASSPVSTAVAQLPETTPVMMPARNITLHETIPVMMPTRNITLPQVVPLVIPTSRIALPETTPVTPTTNINEMRSIERLHINVIPAANIRNFGKKKTPSASKVKDSSGKRTKDGLRQYRHNLGKSRQMAATSAPPQPKLSSVQTTVSSLHLRENQTLRVASQEAATSLASSSGSWDCPTNSLQLRSDMPQYSAFDKQLAPNAVVIPGQQHPVVTSSHILCAAAPRPTTHTAQRRTQMVKAVPSNNPGSLSSGYKSSGSCQAQNLPHPVQQKGQFVPMQNFMEQQHPRLMRMLQEPIQPQKNQQQQYQQHQQQQAQLQFSGNTVLIQQQQDNSLSYLQQYQPVPGQFQNNTTSLQGQVIPAIYTPVSSNGVNCTTSHVVPNFTLNAVIANNNNATIPTNSILVAQSQMENALTPNTDSTNPKATYIPIVTSANPNHPQHKAQSANPVIGNQFISPSLPSASHASTTTTTVNTNQPTTAESVPAPTSQSTGDASQELEPICVMCGSPGIFTCCNNVIYCNTTCQSNDWSDHQHKCTNTS